MDKYCATCSETKNECEFHKRKASVDGLAAKCKSCQRDYDRARAHLPHRVEARNPKLNGVVGLYCVLDKDHPARTDIDVKSAYYKRNVNKVNKANSKYIANNPNKRKAQTAISNAIRDGEIVRCDCSICGKPNAEGHHPDYSKPLDVIWLCSSHHKQWHRDNGPGLNG